MYLLYVGIYLPGRNKNLKEGTSPFFSYLLNISVAKKCKKKFLISSLAERSETKEFLNFQLIITTRMLNTFFPIFPVQNVQQNNNNNNNLRNTYIHGEASRYPVPAIGSAVWQLFQTPAALQ